MRGTNSAPAACGGLVLAALLFTVTTARAQRADGETTHPLLATDAKMLQRFDELRGRDVRVEGKLYESTGMILVSAITTDERTGRTE